MFIYPRKYFASPFHVSRTRWKQPDKTARQDVPDAAAAHWSICHPLYSPEGGGMALKSSGKEAVALPGQSVAGKGDVGEGLVTLVTYAYPKQWFSTYLTL